MKMKFKFLLLAGLLGFSACTNELPNPNNNKTDTIQLVKVPEIYAYSGNQIIGFETRTVGQPDSWAKWQGDTKIPNWPETTNRDESVSSTEYNEVMEYLAANPNKGYDKCSLTSYFLQNVGSAGHTYTTTPDQNQTTHTTGMQSDYIAINGWHVPDYNALSGPRVYVENWPLINCTYHDSFGNNIFNYYKFYYIPLSDGTVGLYLCFDYATISQQGNVNPDGIYDDWVIRIWPADGAPIIPPTEGGIGDLIEQMKNNHVEINLSIEERKGVEWLSSHLSIHVRANTDVEVFIPLPAKFYCALDDLEIVSKHDIAYKYGEESVDKYNVNGTKVTLNVSFEDEGIHVKTNGIDENVISYLKETYGDGLTFEVWNYMNLKVKDWSDPELAHGQDVLGYGQENEITVEELRNKLNGSTVTFTNQPMLYVNAFMYKPGCKENKHTCGAFINDCIVSPGDVYSAKETGYWYNSSPYNELYY